MFSPLISIRYQIFMTKMHHLVQNIKKSGSGLTHYLILLLYIN